MSAWTLVPCLVVLRDEFNKLGPDRDKGADGSIGDSAHRARVSDHNADDTAGSATPYTDADTRPEVHAIDVDLSGPWVYPGGGRAGVLRVVERHRTGADNRLQNVIMDRKIYSRSWGWTAHDYDGDDPHTGHAHMSARYTSAQEADTRPWGVIPEDEVTDTEIKKIIDGVADELERRMALGKLEGGRTLGGSINALVSETAPGAAVPNIINREVAPLIEAAEDRIIAAVKPPAV